MSTHSYDYELLVNHDITYELYDYDGLSYIL